MSQPIRQQVRCVPHDAWYYPSEGCPTCAQKGSTRSQPTNPLDLEALEPRTIVHGLFPHQAVALFAEIRSLREEVTRLKAAPPDERIDRFMRTLVAVKTECGNAMVGAGRVRFDKGVKWLAERIQKVIRENNIPEGGHKGATT